MVAKTWAQKTPAVGTHKEVRKHCRLEAKPGLLLQCSRILTISGMASGKGTLGTV